MNSTRGRDQTGRIRNLFFRELMPQVGKTQEKPFFAIRPDPGASTYYRLREKKSVGKADFEWGSCESFDSLEKALTELWQTQGYPELVHLAPKLAKLAQALLVKEEQEEEVSHLIYAMF